MIAVAERMPMLATAATPDHLPPLAERYAFGEFVVDTRRRTLSRAGAPVTLTPIEFNMLIALLRRQGGVVPREVLEREIWSYPTLPASRVVDRHIARLRRKIEPNADHPLHVVTVPRVGYRFHAT
ncbi:MAG: winged helix-turn-helix domain-containing protein [Gemmatimonadales bacterium]|nr:winged helix-turn-helix domain-containing protein [Gemmatimonadales bacterium]